MVLPVHDFGAPLFEGGRVMTFLQPTRSVYWLSLPLTLPLTLVFTATFTLICLWQTPANACSRLLWNSTSEQVIVGRTMDWSESLSENLYIIPRGLKVDGGASGNFLSWKVLYGSVTSSMADWLTEQGTYTINDGATDGMNEKGMAAHVLFLSGSQYEKRDVSRPAVSTLRWTRYILDNFATVQEALAGMDKVQIVPAKIGENTMDFHLAIEDASGDSAIIEFIGGERVVHHGRNFTVMTNSPPYDDQTKLMKGYKPFGGTEILPGDIGSSDRFTRLSYFSRHLPRTESPQRGVINLLSIMRTVISPINAPYPDSDGASYPTWWVSVSDLKNRVYHYGWLENLNIIIVDLNAIDFSSGGKIRNLDPRTPGVKGLANDLFTPLP